MNTENANNTSSIVQNDDSSTKSNESTISGKRGAENIGLAVFKNDKLVGELTAIECLSYLNMSNYSKGFFISIPNPENSNSYLDLYLTPSNSPQINIDLINGSPYIKIKTNFSAKIYSMNNDSKYLNNNVLDNISASCNSYLESTFSNYLYKTSKEFKSDINGFGNYALGKFSTSKEFSDYNWNLNYINSFFDVKVNTSVKSGILLSET